MSLSLGCANASPPARNRSRLKANATAATTTASRNYSGGNYFVGGSFFAFAGTVACMVFAISRKYRGSNHNARPDVRDVMAFFAYLAAVPLLLIKG